VEKCEVCNEYKRDAFRRAEHGRVVCNECHHELMRRDTPTGLVVVPCYLNGFWSEEVSDGRSQGCGFGWV